MRKAKKKGIHPLAAVLFLVVSGGIAGTQLLGGGLGTAGLGFAAAAPADDPLPSDVAESSATEGVVQWRDLLAAHGSYEREAPVRMAFASLDVGAAPPAAPAGESRPVVERRWVGADPPRLQLGVVMVSSASRRAVVDGRVVGIGDTIGDGRIVSIERGGLVVAWGGRTLTYDLDDPHPREFRDELRQRGGDTKGNQEEVK